MQFGKRIKEEKQVKETTIDLNNLKTTGFQYISGISTNTPMARIFILRNNYCIK